jgi:hypothetical protein
MYSFVYDYKAVPHFSDNLGNMCKVLVGKPEGKTTGETQA